MTDLEIFAYSFGRELPIVPAKPLRKWMQAAPEGFPQRCLPMMIANQYGWWLLNDAPFKVRWNGALEPAGVEIIADDEFNRPVAVSIFGQGILTFQIPYLFRTPPGIQLLVRGPANEPKDGIYALEGIVETDWAIGPFTMNWKITRANHWLEFDQEPICCIVPVEVDSIERFQPKKIAIEGSPDVVRQGFEEFTSSRASFVHEMLQSAESEAARKGWQRHYFQGRSIDGSLTGSTHRTKLSVRRLEETDEGSGVGTFLDPFGH